MTTRTINVDLASLGATLRADMEDNLHDTETAMIRAAMRGVAVVTEATPSDWGHARRGWNFRPMPGGADLYNDVPYVAALEEGSRPHTPPYLPILRWVVRKWGIDLQGGKRSFEDIDEVSKEAKGAAWAIVKNISRNGTKPHWMVKNNLSTLEQFAKDEVEKALKGQ